MTIYNVIKYERTTAADGTEYLTQIADYGGMEEEDKRLTVSGYRAADSSGNMTLYTRKGSRYCYKAYSIEVSKEDEALSGYQILAGIPVMLWRGVVMKMYINLNNGFSEVRNPQILVDGEWKPAASILTATEFIKRVENGTLK